MVYYSIFNLHSQTPSGIRADSQGSEDHSLANAGLYANYYNGYHYIVPWLSEIDLTLLDHRTRVL